MAKKECTSYSFVLHTSVLRAFVCDLVLIILLSLSKSKQGSKVLLYIAVEPPEQSGYKLAITCSDLQRPAASLSRKSSEYSS